MNGECASSFGTQRLPGEIEDRRIAPADQRARLAGRVAEDHRDRRRQGRRVGIERIARQGPPVLHRPHVGGRAARRHELLHRQRFKHVDAVPGQRQRGQQLFRVMRRGGHATGRDLLAAHGQHAVEQAGRGRHGHERRALRAAAGLAEDRDVARIAAELLDVVADPPQGQDQIEDAGVARVGERLAADLGQEQVAEHVQAVVHGHHRHVAAAAQTGAVGFDLVAGAARVAARVEPHEHGTPAAVTQARRPDVQVQAVFAHRPAAPTGLGRDRAEGDRVADAGPRRGRKRRLESPRGGIRAVADALEDLDVAVRQPADPTGRGRRDRRIRLPGGGRAQRPRRRRRRACEARPAARRGRQTGTARVAPPRSACGAGSDARRTIAVTAQKTNRRPIWISRP